MLTKAETEFGDMPIAALEDGRVKKNFSIGEKESHESPVLGKPTIVCPQSRRC